MKALVGPSANQIISAAVSAQIREELGYVHGYPVTAHIQPAFEKELKSRIDAAVTNMVATATKFVDKAIADAVEVQVFKLEKRIESDVESRITYFTKKVIDQKIQEKLKKVLE